MIVVPKLLVYVLTPRTGSRATEQAFLEHVPGSLDVGRHHGYETGFKEPVYATIRNPHDQLLSHYWKERDKITFEDYLRYRTPRLNIHHAVIDKYFIYENGLSNIFWQMGFPAVPVEHVGVSNVDKSFLTKVRKEMINELFKEDVSLYESVVNA